MAKFMPRDLFDAGAYSIAAIYLKSNSAIEDAVNGVHAYYKDSYEDDDLWRQWSNSAHSLIQTATEKLRFESPGSLGEIFEGLAEVVMSFDDSGRRRKKKLFGGTRFNYESEPDFERQLKVSRSLESYATLAMTGQTDWSKSVVIDLFPPENPFVREEVDNCRRLIESGDYRNARLRLKRLMSDGFESWRVRLLEGQAFAAEGRISSARHALEKAIGLNPNYPRILLNLGIVYQKLELFGEAITLLERCIKLDPQCIPAFNSLGLTYRLQGDFPTAHNLYAIAAQKCVEEAYEANREQFTRVIGSGRDAALQIDGQMQEIVGAHLKSTPMYAIVTFNLGASLEMQGRIDEARDKYLESVAMTPPGFEYDEPREALRRIGY